MPFEIYNLENIYKVVYFITQRTISFAKKKILLKLLVGSVDTQTCVRSDLEYFTVMSPSS